MGELELELSFDPKVQTVGHMTPLTYAVFPLGSLLDGCLTLSEICPGPLKGADMNYCWERLGCRDARGTWGRSWGCGTSGGHWGREVPGHRAGSPAALAPGRSGPLGARQGY